AHAARRRAARRPQLPRDAAGPGRDPQLVPRTVAAVARPAAQLAARLVRARPAPDAVPGHREPARRPGRVAAWDREPARLGIQRRAGPRALVRAGVRSRARALP